MAKWFKPGEEEGEGENKPPVIEIKPEMIRDAIKGDLDKLNASSEAMIEFIKEQKEAREAAARKQAEEQRRTAQAHENEEIDFAIDPEGAINKKLRPIAESNAVMASLFLRRELLVGEDFEYYNDPTFKQHVDSIIDSQPIGARTNSDVIKNAYKVAVFDKQKDIKEGKIKSSLSFGSSNNGSRERSETGESSSETMSNEEKAYARKLGVSEKDWLAQKKEMEYV